MLVILDKLNFYLHKFWSFLKPRRKLGLVSFVILASLLVVVLVAGSNAAHAVEFVEGLKTWLIGLILELAGFFIKLTFFILKFVIEVAGYNGFIDSQAVMVGWIMVRDVTNMFFVVVLLLIAFGTILGLEQYEYKKLLVKLLMAAVIVNFSRIICGIIIDVAQVVMITFVNGVAATAGGNLVSMFKVENVFSLTGDTALSSQISGSGSPFLAAVAAVTFASIMMITMLTYLFLLLARMVTLWILIVLSPFAFVLNVLPQTQKYAGQWWTEFGGNVVAGPIVAFFLWLSFVTVGAGNAHNHIRDNSDIPNSGKIDNGVTNPEEEKAGLTSITSWAEMANFAIAVGMLLAGAKMAQQLGAAGGAMMGKAGEFGKKVAMVASGITAARWAGRGVAAGAKRAGAWAGKGVLMKAPLVGGEAWQRRGRGIKAAVSRAWTEGIVKPRVIAAGKRMEKAYGRKKVDLKKAPEDVKQMVAERDAALAANDVVKSKELKDKLEGKGYEVETNEGKTELGGEHYSLKQRGWARAGLFFAPAAFKEEYTKDKEAGAKFAQEQIEHLVSTGKTPIGKFKTKAEAELMKLKATGQDIKARKIQDVLEALGAIDEEILNKKAAGQSWEDIEKSKKYTEREIFNAKRVDNAIKSAANAKQIEDNLTAKKQLRVMEATKALLQTDLGKKRGEEATAVKASLEQLTFDYEQVKAPLVAGARDKVLEDQGRYSEANNLDNTKNIQAEERMKKHAGAGDFVQSQAKIDAQIKRINDRKQEITTELKRLGKSEKEIMVAIEGDERLKIFDRGLSEMQISNLGVHAAVADANRAKILAVAGQSMEQSMDLTAAALRQLQAQDLSELIFNKVEATKEGLEKAMERFVEIHGKELAGSILEQKRFRNEKAAGQGSLGRAGLYNLRDRGDGKLETVLTDVDTDEGLKYVSSRRQAGLSGFKITSSLGLSGSMDRNSAGQAVVKSEGGAKEILIKVVSGITSNRLNDVDEYTRSDLAEILDNSDLGAIRAILAELKEKVADKKGLSGLLSFVLQKDRMKNAVKIAEVKKLVEELEKSGGGQKKKK
jgi:hypothetical protein